MATFGFHLLTERRSYHGIATHYIHSSALPDLETRLAELNFDDQLNLQSRLEIINATIEEFVTGLPYDQPMTLTGPVREAIDECFNARTVEEIISKLETRKNDRHVGDWAAKTLQRLSTRSPTSLKVTLKQMRLGLNWDIAQAFQREYNIASVFMGHHDFTEGVSAKLIKKPAEKPIWSPDTLGGVSETDVDAFFRDPEGEERLQLLNTGNTDKFSTYPHSWIGLPTEAHIREYIYGTEESTRSDVLNHFLQSRQNKLGVKERVEEILQRKTQPATEGGLVWD